MTKNAFSIPKTTKLACWDVKTVSLWGQCFSIGMTFYDEKGNELGYICYRTDDSTVMWELDKWTKENVIPAMEDIAITHLKLDEMMADLSIILRQLNADGVKLLGHITCPIESHIVHSLRTQGLVENFDIPLMADIGVYPEIGCDLDAYNQKYGINVPITDGIHSPLYKSRAIAAAYYHVFYRKKIYNR